MRFCRSTLRQASRAPGTVASTWQTVARSASASAAGCPARSTATAMIGAAASGSAGPLRRSCGRKAGLNRRRSTADQPSRRSFAARAVSATCSGCRRSKASCAALA